MIYRREVFVLTRDKIALTVQDDRMHLKSLKGRLFVTSVRMVFTPHSASAAQNIQSIEIPFRGLWDERFHQPIFAVNNLTASVQYYDGEPFVGELSIKLEFREGGVNTFLPVFNNVLRATRSELTREAAATTGGNQPPPIPSQNTVTTPREYLPGQNDAFVDPSDPSRIYTTQPVAIDGSQRENIPYWSTSNGGLRRRR